jgi:hypothetical protein
MNLARRFEMTKPQDWISINKFLSAKILFCVDRFQRLTSDV